jgi:hypothetical protein
VVFLNIAVPTLFPVCDYLHGYGFSNFCIQDRNQAIPIQAMHTVISRLAMMIYWNKVGTAIFRNTTCKYMYIFIGIKLAQ